MRILLLNYEFPPVGGGASKASFYMARELARRGHHIDVLTCRADGQPEIENVEGVCVYRVASPRKSMHEAGVYAVMSYLFFARRVLKQLLQEHVYDCGHFYFAIPTGLLTFRWRAMTDAPYIISLRGSDVPNYDSNAKTINLLHQVLKPVTSAILRHSHSVVANSESLRELAKESFHNEKIITITNGVCPQDFAPAKNLRQDDRTVTALCVARLIRRKGIDALLEAVAKCESTTVRVVIAGTGPQRNALIEHAKRLGIDNRIRFVGSVNSSEIVAHYQQADFLIHPALVESFSMTLLEAMSCGLPIIASDIGGIPELVEHDINGLLISPGDIPALAKAINRMAESKSLRARFSGASRAKILDQFTWEHITTAYEQQYDSDVTGAHRDKPQ